MADGYRNFDLELFDYRAADDGERLKVRVLSSPAGDQRLRDAGEATIPGGLRRRLADVGRGAAGRAETIAAGRELADVLLPPPVRRLFERSLAELDGGERLRVRLRLDTFALSDLPWEYAYVAPPDTPAGQEGPQGFLALDRRLSIVRYEVLGEPVDELRPLEDGDTLRTVVLLADPRQDGFAALDLDAEQQAIRRALADLPRHRLEVVEHATLAALEDALDEPAAVFHFAGHGTFQAEMGERLGTVEGRGFLVLEGEGGGAEPFAAERLAVNLRRRGVRLVVLGACETGRRDAVNAWSGIAPALTQQGVPAVIGMQSPIADASAVAFHRELYETLAAGGSIDDAVSQGRLAVFNRSNRDNRGDGDELRDWGAPVLYLRSEDGVLFPRPAEETAAEPPARRRGKTFFVNLFLGALVAALGALWVSRLKYVLPPFLLGLGGLGGLLTLFLIGLRWLGGDELRNLVLRWIARRSATGVLAAALLVAAALHLFAVPAPLHLVRLVPGFNLAGNLPTPQDPPGQTYSMEIDSPAWTEAVRVEDLRRQTVYLGAAGAKLDLRIAELEDEAVEESLKELRDALLQKVVVPVPPEAKRRLLDSLIELTRKPRLVETRKVAAGQPLRVRVFRGDDGEPIADVECPGTDGVERTCYIEKGDS